MKNRYDDGVVTESALAVRRLVAVEFKRTRQEMHMTQETLAERAGTQKSNISRMESGNYNPSLDFLVKVADSMGKKVTFKVE